MKAVYAWSYKDILNNIVGYINFLKKNNVTDLYIQFTKNKDYWTDFLILNRIATTNNIKVHATGGEPKWVLDAKYVTEFINAVHEFSTGTTLEGQFSGIHLDIEPYALTECKENKEDVIGFWENIVVYYTSLTDIPISCAVPFWLAKDHTEFYKFMLSKHDHLTIMAYRDTFEVSNGFRAVFEPNLTIANEVKAYKKVVGAVELSNTSEGTNLTFYNDGVEAMENMLNLVNYEYCNNPSFRGVAVHHLGVWKEIAETLG